MFSRVLFYSTNLTEVCCRPLLHQKQKAFGQFRSSFHNSKRNVRRPVLEPEPLDAIPLDSGPLYARSLYKPFAFAIGVSAASIVGCAIWEYERVRSHATQFLRRPGQWFGTHQKKLMTQFQAKNEAGSIKKLWSSLRDSEKVFYPILLANVLVFGAWRVRSLQPVMIKYFCSNPSGTAKCIPMILSTFSHYSPLHLAANMYVLYSFMPAAVASLGKEQFTAMYLSGGVFSSFCSFLYKVAFNQPGLSLGASGAIMAVLSYVCVQYPETKLNIIFLPMYTFAAGTAIKAIMSVDLAGVVLGWKVFDHAAHLGGALFGIAWCHWGSSEIWAHRDKILQYYHALRKPDSR